MQVNHSNESAKLCVYQEDERPMQATVAQVRFAVSKCAVGTGLLQHV